MTGSLLPLPFFKDWDSSGNPLAFGTVATYQAGTSIPIATYTNAALNQVNANPIVLNNRGEAQIWLNPSGGNVKIVVQDNANNQIRIVDNIPPPAWLPIDSVNVHYDQTPAEAAAGVTPTNDWYQAGVVDRYGTNTIPGTTDMTSACTACIAANDCFLLQPDSIYAVTSITFPTGGPHYIDFNGSWIRGIASMATNAVVVLAMEGTTIVDYRVDGNFSQNYLCGTWWYNASSSAQYNTVLSMKHKYFGGAQTGSGTAIRAMIYGALPGNSSTSFAQSENQVYGWRTRGCQNPFYSNHLNGVIHFSEPIFVALNEEWTGTTFNFTNARAFECINGTVNIQGGEVQIVTVGTDSTGTTTYAAVLQNCYMDDMIVETDCPFLVTGDLVRVNASRLFNSQQVSEFKVQSGTTGLLQMSDSVFLRPYNTGSFDNHDMIDASTAGQFTFTGGISSGATSATLSSSFTQQLGSQYISGSNYIVNITFSDGEIRACTLTYGATTCTWTGGLSNNVTSSATMAFETILSDTESYEWRYNLIGADVRLVECAQPNAVVRYKNHRMNITGSDTNVYILNNTPTDSILDVVDFDHIGYFTTGWTLTQDFGGGTSLTATTNAGPLGYPSNQIQLLAPSGQQAIGTFGNPSSLANLKATAIFVRPGDLYWVSAWCQMVTGTGGKLSARFFTTSGSAVSTGTGGGADVYIADSGSITTSWKLIEAPLVAPSTAAFMCVGLFANNGTIALTDLRVRRAA
jgi:hypothetical protein